MPTHKERTCAAPAPHLRRSCVAVGHARGKRVEGRPERVDQRPERVDQIRSPQRSSLYRARRLTLDGATR